MYEIGQGYWYLIWALQKGVGWLVDWDYQSVLNWQRVQAFGPDRLFQAAASLNVWPNAEEWRSRRLSSVLVALTPVSLCGPHWQHGFKNLPHPPPPLLLLLHLHQLARVRRTAIGWASTWLHIKARLNPPAHLFLTLPLPVHLPVQLHLVGRLKAPLAGPHSSPHRIPQRLLLGICTTDRYTTMLNSSSSAFSGANPQDATFSLHYWEWHIENLFPETSILIASQARSFILFAYVA